MLDREQTHYTISTRRP